MHALIAKMTPHTRKGVLVLLAIAIVVVNTVFAIVTGQFFKESGTIHWVNIGFGALVGLVAVVAYNGMVNRLDREKYTQKFDF